MRQVDETDIARWETNLFESPAWDKRNAIIASRITPNDVIWDFGAGHQTLRSSKPADAAYVPIDCVAKTPDTFICDYNADFRLPVGRPTLIVMSGFLEYIVDPEGFLTKLRRALGGTRVVFSWAVWPTDPDTRRANGWISPLVVDPTDPAFFRKHFAELRRTGAWAGQGIYEGVLDVVPAIPQRGGTD